jgi:adenylate cyclase
MVPSGGCLAIKGKACHDAAFREVITAMKVASSLPPGWFRARLYHLLAPLVTLAGVFVIEHISINGFKIGEFLEDQTVNLRFRARAPLDPPADPRLVLVGIDEQSLRKFGQWPWPRNDLGAFLSDLAKAQVNPHTVAFDIMYTEPSPDPSADQAFANGAALLPSVITGALLIDPSGDKSSQKSMEESTRVALQNTGLTEPLTQIHGDPTKIRSSTMAALPIPPLREQSFFGFVNDEPSPVDDIRHDIPLVLRVNGQVYPSLALQILCQMLHVDADKVEVNVGRNVILRNSSGKTWTIPMNDQCEYRINYRNNERFFRNSISFGLLSNALEDFQKGIPLPAACNPQQKTLVIGQVSTGLDDLGPTPIEARSPLVYTHLNVINNVIKNDYLTFVPESWVVIGWLALTWVTLLRLKDAPLLEAVLVPLALTFFYVLLSFGIFWRWSLQISLAWPVLSYLVVNFGGVVLRWREEQQGRQQIKQLFSRMLSPEVMNHLLDHPENVKMGGSERAVTVLFSDIRDYTKFSEGLAAVEVVRQLNIYFERMVACVQKSRGTFHKYIGDAIMAAWGDIEVASLGPERDAQNAVRSSLMMRGKLRELNEERQADGLMPLRIGIGINHGVGVLVGLIGASSRMEFTVMGDAVNTASRLEGLTKEFHTDLAISESVYELLGDDFLVRRLGLIVLKGKTKPIVVYEVLAEKNDLGQSKLPPEFVARYEEAFDHFLARRFVDAEAGFLACHQEYPDDYCVNEYLEASREFLYEPPPPDWDGRIVMKTK